MKKELQTLRSKWYYEHPSEKRLNSYVWGYGLTLYGIILGMAVAWSVDKNILLSIQALIVGLTAGALLILWDRGWERYHGVPRRLTA